MALGSGYNLGYQGPTVYDPAKGYFVPDTSAPASGGSYSGMGLGFVGPKPLASAVSATPLTNQYKLADTAVKQNAEDYSGLMQSYKDVLAKASAIPSPIRTSTVQYANVSPQSYAYKPSEDVTSSLGILKNLAETGGYSDQNLADIRSRDISPIRSVYANAQREIARNRTLSGGYSPNFNAVTAKMARELSSTLADKSTDVNAGIAQMVAQGKLAAASPYASAAGAESGRATDVGLANTSAINAALMANAQGTLSANEFNAGATNDINKFNTALPQNSIDQMLKALSGANSLYGTTPALAQLFGNQALSAAQLQELIQNNNNRTGIDTVNSTISGLR